MMEDGYHLPLFFYMSDIVAAFWFLLPTAHTSVLSSLNTHFQNTPLPHATYHSNYPFISKLVLRAPHATYHSNCPFISKLVLRALCPVALLFQKQPSSQASHNFGGWSACNLPYYSSSPLVISHQNKHIAQVFSFIGILSFYTAFTVFISIALALRLGWFLILVQH